jgi:Amino acid transporters
MGGIIFAFAGYAPAIVLAGEAKNPQKTIPLVLFGSLLICLLVYLVLQVSFIGSLSSGMLSNGWSGLHFNGDTSPFVGLTNFHNLHGFKKLIFLMAILAPLGTALIFIATSSRVAYAMSRNGCFPKVFSKVNSKGVPYEAVILNFFVGMFLFFPSPGWQGMVGFLISAFVLCYVVGPVAVLSLRDLYPKQKRSFKLPFVNLWCFCAFYFSNLVIYWTGWVIFKQMLIAIVIGVVLLCVSVITSKKKFANLDFNIRESIWVFCYLLGMGVITEIKSFAGGHNILPFGKSAVILAVFSYFILKCAR